MMTLIMTAYNRREAARKRLWAAHNGNPTHKEYDDAQKEWSESFDAYHEYCKAWPNLHLPF